jgi:hypothetical protein
MGYAKRIVKAARDGGKIIAKKIFSHGRISEGKIIHSRWTWGWIQLSTIPVDNLVH